MSPLVEPLGHCEGGLLLRQGCLPQAMPGHLLVLLAGAVASTADWLLVLVPLVSAAVR